MRSLAFNISFWLTSAAYVFALAPVSLLPGRTLMRRLIRAYARTIRWQMAHIAGIRVEVRGTERLPQGPFIIAAKHQSYGDGFAMVSHLDDVAFVTGDHLERFPLVGRILQKIGAIVVDNCGGHEARKRLADSFLVAADEGRPVLIYPEGHLSKVGEHHPYRSGVWHMQQASGWPVVPVATNLGLFWSQQDWTKTPGRAVTEFLDPIPPGLAKDAFLERLQAACEGHSARLAVEGRLQLRASGAPVHTALA
jgi:1-acyl-sn-glycerol-3-phosphate acyltransferase